MPPSAANLVHKAYLDSGSSAIAVALRLAQVKASDEVLVPAFHCPTMASPAAALGAEVVFYKIKEDLSCDLDSIRQLISERSRVLLVSHFFGIAHDLGAIRELCDATGIQLIEDCAHMYFGSVGSKPIGTTGDFAVFSTRKFFAGADGGILASDTREVMHPHVTGLGPLQELKYILDVGEESLEFDAIGPWRLPVLALLGLRSFAKRISGHSVVNSTTDADVSEADPVELPLKSMSRISRRLLARSNNAAAIQARRHNFLLLHKMLTGSGAFRTLGNVQAQVEVPYMYPLIVDKPDIYLTLRNEGWPIWRWDDSSRSCSVSDYYAQHLLHVPCHQSLGTGDVEALGEAILNCGKIDNHG